ncbi:extracellular solute-binding protein [Dongia deserti]|uniref:extracellular solute-binding protein n=1 Tax=Dongia deserti TaxID=2268030 RepID=UPI000E6555F6|nr:extracellular solute-binding protein [Dongia deserti]
MSLRRWFVFALALGLSLATGPIALAQEAGTKVHALSLGDAPKYGPDFKHLDYVNPNAPKGGTITSGATGTFDSFNRFIIKGTPAGLGGLFETLTTQTEDDALSEYGLIAESMEVAPDKSWIIYNLRPEARWHDGKPITADDVVFSFDTLMTKGHPQWRYYYADVAKAEKLGERRVKFQFKHGGNRELPVIMGQLPILPKHWWESRNFENVLLEPPLGSGPYKLGKFDMGRSYTMDRVPDYWGKDLPINIGTNNYDQVRVTYFQDPEIQMEAFKSGVLDTRPNENSAKRWSTGYEFPAVKDGRVIKEVIPHENPAPIQGFIFNIRKPMFQDPKVREAIIYAFDFEWSNKALFYGLYTRTRSYFQNSEMEAKGLPSPEELEILNPLKDQIPPEVFTTEYNPPKTDGSGNARDNLEKAAALLNEAGWKVENGRRVKDGRPFQFEILVDDQPMERVALPFAQNLERIGVRATVRVVDSAQYQSRMENFDFDMTSDIWGVSLSPGNEQSEYWGSASADTPGSGNTIGIENPAVDKLIELIVNAQTREELIIRCRALDRVLQWNYYLVPHFHSREFRVAYWNRFGMPKQRPDPLYSYGSTAWWIDQAKDAALAGKKVADQPVDQAAAAPAPAPAQAQPSQDAPAPAAETAPTGQAEAERDRGQSPLIYAGGAIAVVVVAYLLGRRRRKSS